MPNMNQISLELFQNYVYGKQKRVRFIRVGKQKKSENLELVHTDVWGPTQYNLLVALVILLLLLMMQLEKLGFIALDKNLVFDTFKKWKSLAENETGKRLKCLNLIMEVNNTARSLIVTVHTIGFIERIKS